MSEQPTQSLRCLNCEAVLDGRFCASCGQDSLERRGPFHTMVRELAKNLLELDSVVLRSIPTLLLKPGRLTREYLDGRRASQLPPLRLYLFVSVLFFLLFAIPKLDASDVVLHVGDVVVGEEDSEDKKHLNIRLGTDDDWEEGKEGFLGRKLREQEKRLQAMTPQQLADSIVAALNDAIPKALILFVPLLAVCLRLLFVFTDYLYFDHLIFALHFQSTVFLSLIFWAPFSGTIFGLPLLATVLLALPMHGYLAMRHAYVTRGFPLGLRYALFAGAYACLLMFVAGGVGLYTTLVA